MKTGRFLYPLGGGQEQESGRHHLSTIEAATGIAANAAANANAGAEIAKTGAKALTETEKHDISTEKGPSSKIPNSKMTTSAHLSV